MLELFSSTLQHVGHQAHGGDKGTAADRSHGRVGKTLGLGRGHSSTGAGCAGRRLRSGSGGTRSLAAAIGDRVLRRDVLRAEGLDVVVASVLAIDGASVLTNTLAKESLANEVRYSLLVELDSGTGAVGGASAVPLQGCLWGSDQQKLRDQA